MTEAGSIGGAEQRGGRALCAVALLVCFAGLLGCQSEVAPESISASVVDYGEFEIKSGLPTLKATTSKIQCEQGKTFGIDYVIEVANGEYGVVPVEFRWTHPELAIPSRRLWGRESSARRSNPRLPWREKSLTGRVLWSLEHPDELVSGEYEIQIRIRDGRGVLLSHIFEIEGC